MAVVELVADREVVRMFGIEAGNSVIDLGCNSIESNSVGQLENMIGSKAELVEEVDIEIENGTGTVVERHRSGSRRHSLLQRGWDHCKGSWDP